MYAADLIERLVADHAPHLEAYLAYENLLSELACSQHATSELVTFQWALLNHLGYHLRLAYIHQDIREDKGFILQADQVYYFSPDEGGLIDQRQHQSHPIWPIRGSTLLCLQHVHEKFSINLQDMTQAEATHEKKIISDQTYQRANRFLCSYFRHMIGKELYTMRHILKEK